MTLPGITKHLKVLEHAGLIARGRQAQWRPCRLEAGPLKDVSDWVEYYRQFWEQSFDRLDDYLRELQKTRKTQPVDGAPSILAKPNRPPSKGEKKKQ